MYTLCWKRQLCATDMPHSVENSAFLEGRNAILNRKFYKSEVCCKIGSCEAVGGAC